MTSTTIGDLVNFLIFWGIWLLIPLSLDMFKAILYLISLLKGNKDADIDQFNLEFYPYVTIVIPIYNSAGTLRMCLESLINQSYPNEYIQIICIDNGSKDNSFELFQKFQSENHGMSVMWVSIERPSKSIALNVGMYSGQGTYLINLDSDTWLDKDAIMNVVKTFEQDSTLMAATGSIRVDKTIEKRNSFVDYINYCEIVEYLISFDIGKRYQSMTNTVFTLSGAFSAFRRETIMQSFLYQERTVSEDTDLTFHIRNAIKEKNGRIGCITRACAYVEPIESLSRLYSQRLRWQRGEVEVASAYFRNVPNIFKSTFNLIGRTLITDHTLALAQMSWTFLMPLMFMLGYSLPMLADATACMFASYLVLDLMYFSVAYKGADKPFRKELTKIWWIVFMLPLYRYFLYWFRLAGNIQALAEGKSWKVQNPIEQTINVLKEYKNSIKQKLKGALSSKRRAKTIARLATVTLIIALSWTGYAMTYQHSVINNTLKYTLIENGISYVSRVDSKYFYLYQDGKWQKTFIKGVNIGVGEPGKFPGELSITKKQYMEWFKYISDMHANTVRVYTIQMPEFYSALYDFNKKADNKLYLIQGVWINEDDIVNYNDAFNTKIYTRFRSDTKDAIDVLHGNTTLMPITGFASGTYTKDVSPYVIGYNIGIESNAEFVSTTNKQNTTKNSYSGKYLYTEGASPFETFYAEIEDYAINYETSKYKAQKPMAFTNWVTTDMLTHTNEPIAEMEDAVPVNPEHIKAKDNFKAGLFASYHIYPYYPDFMNYQKEYINYKNADGKVDTYRAYLNDLLKQHDMPVLVSEFGVPTSRGITHTGLMGFNQGGVTEKQQGDMNAYMLQDIHDAGYAGGLIFTWQDEWFKRTWNNMDLDMADRRPFWSNTQTSEQAFGLLEFEPGSKTSICYVDGDTSEWKKDKPTANGENIQIYTKSDEKYMYFMANAKNFDFKKDKVLIPIDSIQDQGNTEYTKYNVTLQRPSDFIIEINGKENSRIMIDAYYDSFYYMYAIENKMIPVNTDYEVKGTNIFNPEYLCTNRELFLPEDKKIIPFSKYETGKLLYGNANPNSGDYNSLADFIVNRDNIEIRIPWQLLNVEDPSSKMIMNDLYKGKGEGKGGVKPIKTDGMYIGGILLNGDKVVESTNMSMYSWAPWETPTYHERLKDSYYILKDTFEKIK